MYKDLIKGKKGVIFDLDGTIVDTQHLWEDAMVDVFRNVTGKDSAPFEVGQGQFIEERWKDIIDLYQLDIGISPKDLTNQTYTKFLTLLEFSELSPKRGFWGLLQELKLEKNLKVAIATNTIREIGEQVVKHFSLDKAMDLIVYGDDVSNKKPHPEIYLETAKRLQLKPKELLVFEDSPVGAKAAKQAGMDLIIIWNSTHLEAEFPNDILGIMHDFSGIEGYLDQDSTEVFKRYFKLLKQQFPQTEK